MWLLRRIELIIKARISSPLFLLGLLRIHGKMASNVIMTSLSPFYENASGFLCTALHILIPPQ